VKKKMGSEERRKEQVLNISCGGFSERSQDFSTTSIS
jgi:hypothetical protein